MIVRDSKDTYFRTKGRAKIKKLHPNLQSNQIVHHIDGNPKNNELNNLQILTPKEHIAYHKSKTPLINNKVIQITLPDETYKLLEEKAGKEKLRIATYIVALIRKVVENGNAGK